MLVAKLYEVGAVQVEQFEHCKILENRISELISGPQLPLSHGGQKSRMFGALPERLLLEPL